MQQGKTTSQLLEAYLRFASTFTSAVTQRARRRFFARILKFLNGRELSYETALEYQLKRQDEVSTSSVRAEFKNLRAFVNWQIDNDFATKNYLKRIKLPPPDERPDFPDISPELVDKIIIAGTETEDFVFAKCGDTPISSFIKSEERPAMRLMLRTAIRIGGAIGLKGSDLNLDSNKPTFVIKPKGKRREQLLAIPQDMVEELKKRQNRERVFQITDDGCNRALERGIRKLNLHLTKKLTCHSLRHICATNLIREGTPLPVVQELLGHANIEMTISYYTHMNIRDITKAINSQPIVKHGLTIKERIDGAEKVLQEYIGVDERFTLGVEKSENRLILRMEPTKLIT